MSEAAMTLADLLDGYKATALVVVGTTNGWFKSGVPKHEMVRRLATELAKPDHVRRSLAQLDGASRAALTLLQHMGGAADADELRGPLQDDGVVAPDAMAARYAWDVPTGDPSGKGRAFVDVVARLEVRGLVLGSGPLSAGASVTEFGASTRYVIPREVRAQLPPPPPLPPARPPAFEREVLGDATAFGRQLYLTWSYLWRHKPRLLNSGLLSKRDVTALAAQMTPNPDMTAVGREDDLPYLHFQRVLLEALSLVAWPNFGSCRVDEAQGSRFWSLPLEERVSSWYGAWQTMGGWNELTKLGRVKWSVSSAGDRSTAPKALPAARAFVAGRVGELGQAGEWVGVGAAATAIRRTGREFLLKKEPQRGAGSYGGYYVSHGGGYGNPRNYNSRYSRWGNPLGWEFDPIANDNQGWERVETELIRNIVRALHWLGLCDVGEDGAAAAGAAGAAGAPGQASAGATARSNAGAKGNPNAGADVVAFRLNDLGRQLLGPPSKGRRAPASRGSAGSGPAADPEHGARIVVQPNFRIMAIGPVPMANLMRIERFADRVGTDRVLEYELTRRSVYRGQQDGLSGGQIVAALAEMSGADVPQNVARSVDEWQALHEVIVVHRQAVLVQAADSAVMERLHTAGGEGGDGRPSARAPMLAAVAGSPTLARVVDPKRLGDVFRRLGLAPATRHDPAAAGGVAIDGDGIVHPTHKVISLYLLGQLQRLAEWDAGLGVWRVTEAAAVRAKSELGLDAPAQLAKWTTLCAGGPPEWLDRRLKAWCAHYGSAKVHRPVLVELPSEASLTDLLADPRGAALVKRFKPRGPLVEVDGGDVEALRRVLEEFGIAIRGVG